MTRYNFDDPLIRTMVDFDHTPEEKFVAITTAGQARSNGIRCRTCHEPWPCAARRAYRRWVKREKEGPPA